MKEVCYLFWLLISPDPDAGLQTGLYKDFMPSMQKCEDSKVNLAEKLLYMGYDNFTISCECSIEEEELGDKKKQPTKTP